MFLIWTLSSTLVWNTADKKQMNLSSGDIICCVHNLQYPTYLPKRLGSYSELESIFKDISRIF